MQKIVVPIDFSDSSVAALRFAVQLGLASGMSVAVYYVYNSLISSNWPESPSARQEERCELERKLKEFTQRHTRHAGPKLSLSTTIGEGVPPTYMLWRSRDEDTALIVMGGGAGGGGGKMDLYGSIARLVSEEGSCPVILVPKNYTEKDMKRIFSVSSASSNIPNWPASGTLAIL